MSQKRSTDKQSEFEKVFLSNYQTFFSIAFNMCRDREVSKDLIQDFFLEVWEKQLWEKEIQDVAGYLFRSFYRKVIKRRKQDKSQRELLISEGPEPQIPSFEELLIEVQEQNKLQSKIKEAMQKLPVKQQEVLELKFKKGLDYEEIASTTGKSTQTIYNQIHSAMKKLRKSISSSLLS